MYSLNDISVWMGGGYTLFLVEANTGGGFLCRQNNDRGNLLRLRARLAYINNKISFTRIQAKAPNPCGTTRAYSGKNFFPIYAKASVRGTDLRQIAPNREFELLLNDGDSGNHNNNNNDGPHGGGGGDDYSNNGDDGEAAGSDPFDADYFLLLYSFTRTFSIKRLCDFFVKANKNLVQKKFALLLVSLLAYMAHTYTDSSTAFGEMGVNRKTVNGDEEVWEVKGSRWTKLLADPFRDLFIVNGSSPLSSDKPGTHNVIESFSLTIHGLLSQGKDLVLRLMLPEGYPDSVTSDYLDYSLWRGVQGIASQISGVLATQSLLYAVGLGKGAIPTAAAINWVLKDGIGYLSKIVLSKYGRHFDVNPKGWRLFADLLENAAFGLEILTPAFPHLFVFIGAVAGAGRSAASLIQAATRSCFYAGFAAKRNFAEVIAKGEAQGMVSKFVGIMLGIALANFTGSSTSLALATFGVITWIHMYCNLKSYQSIQLRSLNPYRASLIFSEYLLSGQVPSVTEVNAEEPLFPAIPWLNLSSRSQLASEGMSAQAKNAAAEIDRRLQLGAKLSTVIRTRDDAVALFDLYKHEGYILTEYQDNFFVVLKESATPLDMLKSIFQVNYLYWLEHIAGIKSRGAVLDCVMGGKLQLSLDYVRREFGHAKVDSELAGWVGDGLIARPAPNRVSLQLPR